MPLPALPLPTSFARQSGRATPRPAATEIRRPGRYLGALVARTSAGAGADIVLISTVVTGLAIFIFITIKDIKRELSAVALVKEILTEGAKSVAKSNPMKRASTAVRQASSGIGKSLSKRKAEVVEVADPPSPDADVRAAARRGDLDDLRHLAMAGADVDASDEEGRTALHDAADCAVPNHWVR